MPPVPDQAVCVRQWDWSETSQTVMLLTRGHGVMRALAKGSRRPKSPFSGGVELLTVAEIGLIIKPGSGLSLLTEWDLTEHFPALRKHLVVYHAGLYGAELVVRMIGDHDPHPDLFDGLVTFLRMMDGPSCVQPALLTFQARLLHACGFKPVLDRDVQTGDVLGQSKVVRFVPELGGVITSESEPTTPEGRVLEAWKVRRSTIDALMPALSAAGDGREASPLDVERGNRLLGAYIRTLIGGSPRTLGLVIGPLEGPKHRGNSG